ncbi:tRNA (5-methylaminomethyl-2-thiouridine)(34)-methyltransferase MnmD [Hymenobacter chitinivorans]|uniref:tRNA U34 5-methylaminomethyl-2-thiouridine-forming methyltransferase MnmC n=1 Tax=Hymenobacter chitinivorans DSM 11115 TaxID=1121954 RepID=A0A2M9B577_9BACT|nr:tRNA (5-methylaminomethyl-2-thiouridine)(34)-methyltransferase MnmD [Hymenobacter chitinivorans]PJJ53103.1 tRNA U34 5-methylaminomethyl-2-thiouridine-forming methyltransferase MnmC [Hymenobacter chitinivorans DSM 11115]
MMHETEGGVKVEVRTTADGSSTLYVPALDEHYHSTHGALQEAMHVYLAAGLEPALTRGPGPVRVLEIGFGTGLNALLTLQRSLTASQIIEYDTLEKYPLPPAVIQSLGVERYVLNPELRAYHEYLHAAPWHEAVHLTEHFVLRKMPAALQDTALPAQHYDVVYFDAFAPEKQPDMWTEAVFEQLFAATAPGGVLVSYCAKGSFRRSLKAAGWLVEKLPGPPGKREMTRARKDV